MESRALAPPAATSPVELSVTSDWDNIDNWDTLFL